jgi:outer membrane protein OmpA-like peptidoglycan-associated protein
VLDELARALETYPEVRLEIAVYARSAKGPVGETKEANLLLSQQRALALVQELVSRGISQARLEGRGLGEGEAVAPGAPVAEGERVEVLLGAP